MTDKKSRKVPETEREFEKHLKDTIKWMGNLNHKINAFLTRISTGDLFNDEKTEKHFKDELRTFFLLKKEYDKITQAGLNLPDEDES